MPKVKISKETLRELRKTAEKAGLIDSFEEIKEMYISLCEYVEEEIKINNHNKRVARI